MDGHPGVSAYLVQLDRTVTRARCRDWQLRVRIGTRGASRPMMTEVRHGIGYRAAMRELDAFADRIARGDVCKRTSWTFAAYAARWNDGRMKLSEISQKTHDRNGWMLSAAARHLGTRNLADITPEAVTAAYVRLRDGDSPSARKWSLTSLGTLHNVLVGMFSDAVTRKLIPSSPMDAVKRPRNDTAERKALTISQAVAFVDGLSVSDHHAFAIMLMVGTGMRGEEVCGATWGDVHDGCIEVRREVTKTDAGSRMIPLGIEDEARISMRRDFLADSLAAFGSGPDPSMALACDDSGGRMAPDALRRWWGRHRGEMGMDGWTLHEFRHSYISELAESGAGPAIMRDLAGHSDSRVSIDVYTHVNSSGKRSAVEELDAAKRMARSANGDA